MKQIYKLCQFGRLSLPVKLINTKLLKVVLNTTTLDQVDLFTFSKHNVPVMTVSSSIILLKLFKTTTFCNFAVKLSAVFHIQEHCYFFYLCSGILYDKNTYLCLNRLDVQLPFCRINDLHVVSVAQELYFVSFQFRIYLNIKYQLPWKLLPTMKMNHFTVKSNNSITRVGCNLFRPLVSCSHKLELFCFLNV